MSLLTRLLNADLSSYKQRYRALHAEVSEVTAEMENLIEHSAWIAKDYPEAAGQLRSILARHHPEKEHDDD